MNGKTYSKDSTIPLNGGDEVSFSSSSGKHAYVSFMQTYFSSFFVLYLLFQVESINLPTLLDTCIFP